MQRIMILALLCLTGSIISQNYRYYKPGQNFSSTENACLVLKNDKRTLLFLNDLDKYASFKAIKLVGFNKPGYDMDSLINMIDEFANPKVLIFENCDLLGLTEPLAIFNELEEVSIIGNCSFFENELYDVLKDCPVKRIAFQKADEDLATDSLHLLKQLLSLQISSNNKFTVPNRTDKIQFANENRVQTIELTYFGDFYKEHRTKNAVADQSSALQQTVKNSPMACIKQPIPGIDINDTVYNFNSLAQRTIFYESGSKITIDKNAFVTATGQNYTGNVKLFYREFRNPVEIMLSGIPMSTKVGDKMELFKSGGMYEINAFDANGNPLKTRSDTSIKINFALTDTSENFQFYSLNNDGSWTTKDTVVNTFVSGGKKDSSYLATRAVREYYGYLYSYRGRVADTTNYEARFLNRSYLYTYRTDNLYVSNDSVRYFSSYAGFLNLKKNKAKSFFRIKYVKQTKEKEIVFTIVPANKNVYVPRHIQPLLYRTYVYTGNLNKEEFRKLYNRQLLCWDLRLNSVGDGISLNIKTDKAYVDLNGKAVTLMKDGSYYVHKRASTILCHAVKLGIKRDARRFNEKIRSSAINYNNLNGIDYMGVERDLLAFNYSKKYQSSDEKKMDLTAWKKYVKNRFPNYYYDSFQYDNAVGNALVKSGLGINNIDCYIHSGQMEPVYVNYDVDVDSLSDQHNAILFKSINTSYPISKSYVSNSLGGYYFKKHENYIVRFSNNGYMQVTKPNEVKDFKKGSSINIAYQQQHNVKNMTSKDITRLILD